MKNTIRISNLVVFLPRENLPLVAKLPVDLPLGSQIYKVAFGGGGEGRGGRFKVKCQRLQCVISYS